MIHNTHGPRPRRRGGYGVSRWLAVGLLAAWLLAPGGRAAEVAKPWWGEGVEQALAQAGTNRGQWLEALAQVPQAQREGLEFLLANMPRPDLGTLSGAFVLENLTLAYQAAQEAPWADRIPKEVFLDDVLPYANVTEAREPWRKELRALCLPLVRGATTPGAAAQALNQKLFPLVRVKYSTRRKRPDQSPRETMASGVATCTGLSILLVDACRAVGVPARLAGTPLWVNLRGNHTWVEVWDQGWHFLGAAEPDPNGLDRGWFTQDASQALRDVPQHAIYATSFARTGLSFPLVWAPEVRWVGAVNVTDRYAHPAAGPPPGQTRVLIRVVDRPQGQRVAARVSILEPASAAVRYAGLSRGETADLNDLLRFDLPWRHHYQVEVAHGKRVLTQDLTTGTNTEALLVIPLAPAAGTASTSAVCPAPPPPLTSRETARLRRALAAFFAASPERQARWRFGTRLDRLLDQHEAAVRHAAWEAFQAAPSQQAGREDFDARRVRFDAYTSPYTVRAVGVRPANGWALFIALHGGGGVPKAVNDQQWRVMQHYYRDHPEAGGYLYVALRAPNDTWNGFYDGYVYPLVDHLIRQFLLFGDVDPDKVFLMGYSHGGYGAFAIGPKMPDCFAAIHASAAAPTEGETTPVTLRHTIFTYMIGEKDTAYGRIERCRRFDQEVRRLRGDRSDIYPVTMQFVAGNGHTGLPDRDLIPEMYPATRDPAPRTVDWALTDNVIHDLFWLHVPAPAKREAISAQCVANRITVTTTNLTAFGLRLDSRLVDFHRPVTLVINGRAATRALRPRLSILCRTLAARGDPELAFTAEWEAGVGAAASAALARPGPGAVGSGHSR